MRPNAEVVRREDKLRRLLARGKSDVMRIIDAVDVGWTGVQAEATKLLRIHVGDKILDACCGYGHFAIELAWRYPRAFIVGLNLDFDELCAADRIAKLAGVASHIVFVEGDVTKMRFPPDSFDAAVTFLGLQDVVICRGVTGPERAVAEMTRVTRSGGKVMLLDTFGLNRLRKLVRLPPLKLIEQATFRTDIRWNREVAEKWARLAAQGFVHVAAMRSHPVNRRTLRKTVYEREMRRVKRQIAARGWFSPAEEINAVVCRKQ